MDMQHYTLSLFGKDDTRFELRILDAQQQVLYTSQPIALSDIDPLEALVADHYRVTAPDLRQQGQACSTGWINTVGVAARWAAVSLCRPYTLVYPATPGG